MRTIDRGLADSEHGTESFELLPRAWKQWWETPHLFTGLSPPLLDLQEQDEEFVLRIDVPGVNKEHVHVRPRNQGIEIRAEKQKQHEKHIKGLYRQEREQQGFYRYCALDEDADVQNAQAKLKNGVLEIRIPKRVSSKEHKEIKVTT